LPLLSNRMKVFPSMGDTQTCEKVAEN